MPVPASPAGSPPLERSRHSAMSMTDTSLRRDWVFAAAWLATTVRLKIEAVLAPLAAAMPRLRLRSARPTGAEPASIASLRPVVEALEASVTRCANEAQLHRAATAALESVEDEFLQVMATVGGVMRLPVAQPEANEPQRPEAGTGPASAAA